MRSATSASALLLLLAPVATEAYQCDAPFKTLSSDCRGGTYDANTACLVIDQSTPGLPTPCRAGYTPVLKECARYTDQSCDVLSYGIKYQDTQARFHITFLTSDNDWRGNDRRALVADDDTPLGVAWPPSRGLRAIDTDGRRLPEIDGDAPSATTSPAATALPIPTSGIPVVFTSLPPSGIPIVNTTPPPTATPVVDAPEPTPIPPVGKPGKPVKTQPNGGTRVDADPTPSPSPITDNPPTAEKRPTTSPSVPPAETPVPRGRVESNAFVDSIGELRLDPALKDVRIIGGRNEFGTRAQVATLSIDPLMLAQSPQVTSLSLLNCNLGDQFASGSYLSKMPSGLLELNLRNTMMRHEPSDLSALQNLRSLKMEQNFLSTLSSKVSLPKLTLLDVTDNMMTGLEAQLPMLESLYLSKNYFDTIPEAVYSMSKLKELHLTENRIVALVVSDSQYKFLSAVRITMDSPVTPPPPPVVFVPKPGAAMAPVTTTAPVGSATPTPVASSPVLPSLNDTTVNLNSTVAKPVGTLTSLNGIPVWKVPDADFAIFTAQQQVIAKSDVVIDGKKVQPYKAAAAAEAAAVVVASSNGAAKAAPKDAKKVIYDNVFKPSASEVQRTPGANPSQPSDSRPIPNPNTTSIASPVVGGQEAPANAAQSVPTLDTQTAVVASGSGNSKTLTLSLLLVAAVAVVVIAILVVRHQRRTIKASTSSASTLSSPRDAASDTSFELVVEDSKAKQPNGTVESGGASVIAPQGGEHVRDLFTSRRIRVVDLGDVRPISAGSTSVVWLVKLRGSGLLASKRLIQSSSRNQHMAEFVNEVMIAADLDHPSITRLAGVAWTNESDLQVLFEYMPNGDLATYLQQIAPPGSLSWPTAKLQLAIDIVEALVYTHSFSPPLLHRDLRARNVMLDEDMRPKLSSFGQARFGSEQSTMTTHGVGSGRWLAPEILSGRTDYDAASDMYAFGVLLSELDTHAAPYEDVCDASRNAMTETALLERVTRGVLRPSFSADCPLQIRELASRCVSQDPRERPMAMQVAYELRVLLREWEE